jgi:hypothetical protein
VQQDANNFFVNDLGDFAHNALMFIRRLVTKDPVAAQELCEFKNQRLLYVLERLDQQALRRLLSHNGIPMRPRAEEIERAFARIDNNERPAGLVDAPAFFSKNERDARDLERIQQEFWTLIREEARRRHFAFQCAFDINDHQLTQRIADMSLADVRFMARFPIALRVNHSPGFELALQFEGQGVVNPVRLAVAGLAAACYDAAPAEHAEGIFS